MGTLFRVATSWLALACFGLPYAMADQPPATQPATGENPASTTQPWSENNEVRLLVEPLPFDRARLNDARFRLTLTNTSKKELIFDRELVVGINLHIMRDASPAGSGYHRFVADNEKNLQRPPPEAWKTRFVTLKPGQSLTRQFDLSKPVRYVYQGHATDLEHRHFGFYSERTGNYKVPEDIPRIHVGVLYERAVWMMARPQFTDWHGKDVHEIGVWTGRANSNLLRIAK